MSNPTISQKPQEEDEPVSLAALRRREADSDDEEISATEVLSFYKALGHESGFWT